MQTTGCNSWRGHRWSRWGDIVWNDAVPGLKPGEAAALQRRECERCGMVQMYHVVRLTGSGPNDRG